MRILLILLVLFAPAVATAQPDPEESATQPRPMVASDFDWRDARKLTLDAELIGDEGRIVRGTLGASLHPANLKKGTTGKLVYWVFKVDSILNEQAVLLQVGDALQIALEGYPTRDIVVNENLVILDYIYVVGNKPIKVGPTEMQRYFTIKILSNVEKITHEDNLKKKGYVPYVLKTGETFLGKCNKPLSTKNAIAITTSSGNDRYFILEDFTPESVTLLTSELQKAAIKLPVPPESASQSVKDQAIKGLKIANLYSDLSNQDFAVQIDSKKAPAGSHIVRWHKDRHKLEIVELDGGIKKVSLIITADGKLGDTTFTDEDRTHWKSVAEVPYHLADPEANSRWALKNFDTPAKRLEAEVTLETFAKENARALVIHR